MRMMLEVGLEADELLCFHLSYAPSQLIFSPLADEREAGHSGRRGGVTTAARRWRRYVRVIACVFVLDIVSHLICCLSPHP